MSETKLTEKQQRFCEEYVIDFNATRAAKAAGYSVKTAYSIGHNLLKKIEIQTYISGITTDLAKTANISALGLLLELKKVAFSNITDLKTSWSEFKNLEDIPEEVKGAISEITHSKTTFGDDGEKLTLKVKMHDKLRAIEKLTTMLGFDKPTDEDANQHKGGVTINIGAGAKVELPSKEDDIKDFTNDEFNDD